jgi:uridylate kinase
MSKKIIYKRVLLKFSGEALAGGKDNFGIDPKVINNLVQDVIELLNKKIQVALVIGGGNLFRGKTVTDLGLTNRIIGDQIGMLATVMNALLLAGAFEQKAVDVVVMSAFSINGIVETYDHKIAIRHLEANRLVIFAGGTGNPLVTTDSAASLRALEINADVLLKATQVNGIYSHDPKKHAKAVYYEKLTYKEVLQRELKIMDLGAFVQCRDYGIKIIVFNINKPKALLNIIYGKKEGTIVE